MCLDQVFVCKVDARWEDRARDHLLSVTKEMVVVGIAIIGEGKHQRRSPAAPGASAALCIIGRRRRNVAKMDSGEVADVDSKLHRRRTEENRQLAFPELFLALDSKIHWHLAGVLGRG